MPRHALSAALRAVRPATWLTTLLCAVLLSILLLPAAQAQSAANGKVLYTTPDI